MTTTGLSSRIAEIGKADVVRTGSDVTIVATLLMLDRSVAAAAKLAEEGIDAEVIDLRWIRPIDLPTIRASVEKTGRLVVADQSTRHGSAATVIAAEVASQGFSSLRGPVQLVCALDATVPYSEPMEAYLIPDAAKIVTAVQQAVGEAPVPA